MITHDLQTCEEILGILNENWHDHDETMLPPMFHGTDESLVNASAEERLLLNGACEVIIASLVTLLEENSISMMHMDDRLFQCRDSHGTSATAYRFAKARLENSALYSYGDFYVSNHPQRAIGFSQEAWIFGETGWVTNRLVEGTIALGLDLPDHDDFRNAFAMFESRKQREKKPAVLMVVNSDSSALFMESGENIKDMFKEEFADEIQNIKEYLSTERSYRLNLPASERGITVNLIRKGNYLALLNAWKKFERQRKDC